ncbi:MAG: carboxypeptidase regulatory-like domain-containing protein [Candidatus Solibacter sp.]|nr:carboxypeptidase regulatory-like domain-containing protein [Candidatus Solibacter sp.]
MKVIVLAMLALAIAATLSAQEFRGTIGGTILDASGGTIAGAKIHVTESQSGTKAEATSDADGHYNVPLLLAGDYEIAVRMPGFKEFVRKGVHLGAGDRPTLDVRLEVGDTSATVEVIADAPLVNSENASVGDVITAKEVEDLPSNGGTPLALLSLAPGVLAMSQPTQVLPFASGGAASFSMGGIPNQQNELLTDGVPNTTWDGRLAYSPPKDAVSEVRAKVFDTDTTFGRTAGGTANTILKSGTNALHGTVSWLNQPNNLVANNFFNNKAGLSTPVTHFNQAGATVSGPLYVPKVLDGRNRVFWLFAFEDIQSRSPNTTIFSVPTDAMKQGDFSKLLAVNATTIYDPATAVKVGTSSTITRTAFPGNKIPSNRLNPIALKYAQFIAAPNITDPSVVRKDDFNNFGNNATTSDGFTNEFGRLDFNIGSRSRTYFNVRHTDYYQNKNNYFDNLSTGSNLSRSNWGGSFDQVYLVNSTNILNLRMNFTRMFEDHSAPSAGVNPGDYGFPAYLAANSQYMTFSGNSGYTTLGLNGANTLPSQTLQGFASWSTMKGNHAIKVGADVRQYRLNYKSYGYATGGFSFSANTWVRSASNASSATVIGQDWASFLLGLPTNSSGSTFDINTSGMFYAYYAGVFVQDDWRIRKDLTLNIGVRIDHDFPYHETWGRTVNGFARDATNPLNAAAAAAYAGSAVSQLPANQFKVMGGLTFASPDNTAAYSNKSRLVSPRIGLAWTPGRMHGKTVLRVGGGMFVAPVTIAQLGASGAYSTNPLLTQQGFSQSTAYKDSATLSNPFPAGIQRPVGSANGLATFANQAISFLNPEVKSPYALRWNFSVQHSFTPNLMLEVTYLGTHSVHLPVSYTQLNGLPRQFLSTSGVRDQALITALAVTAPNPFAALVTGASATSSTAQLLARYPQYPVYAGGFVSSGAAGVVQYNLNVGSAHYNAFNTRMVKRFSKGLQLTLGYMKSNNVEQMTWMNDSDPVPERRLSPFDRPTRITVTMTYDLPVGKGRLLDVQSRPLNAIVGGWKIATTYQYQAGGPIVWNNGDYVYFGGGLKLDPRSVDSPSFDKGVFDTNSANQFQYHVRTFSTTYSSLRSDGINDLATSLMKDFRLGEKFNLQFKADAFNAINHPVFAAPNVTPTNSTFGTITAQANRPRMMQLSAKINF